MRSMDEFSQAPLTAPVNAKETDVGTSSRETRRNDTNQIPKNPDPHQELAVCVLDRLHKDLIERSMLLLPKKHSFEHYHEKLNLKLKRSWSGRDLDPGRLRPWVWVFL